MANEIEEHNNINGTRMGYSNCSFCQNSNEEIQLTINAMSVETSNGKTEYGDKIDVKWFTKSLYEKKATLFSENIRNIQYTGEETIIKTQWMIEDNIQSGFIEYKINDKFKIMRNNTILTPYKQVGEECIYRVEVKNPKTSTQEEIKVINPQEYKEAANLVIHSFFSKESNYWNVEESTKWEELNQKLILESNKKLFHGI